MFGGIRELWSGSAPVEFESDYSLDKSVERLRAATRRSALFVTSEVAAGTVSESRVSLCRVIPMFQNSFKPFFVGRFERRGGKVVLRGRFVMQGFVRAFFVFWMGMTSLMCVVGTVAALRDSKALPFPMTTAAMLLFGLGLLRLGGWLSRNDPAWLSVAIRTALAAPDRAQPSGTTPSSVVAPLQAGRPNLILVASAVTLLWGVLGLVSAVTGIQSYQGAGSHAVISHYPDMRERYAAGAFAVLALLLSFGIYRQRLFAWRLGFVFLVGAYALSVLGLLSRDDLGNARIPSLIFCALGVGIMALWARWWYAQRRYFRD